MFTAAGVMAPIIHCHCSCIQGLNKRVQINQYVLTTCCCESCDDNNTRAPFFVMSNYRRLNIAQDNGEKVVRYIFNGTRDEF